MSDRKVKEGDVFVADHKETAYECRVVTDNEGAIRYQVGEKVKGRVKFGAEIFKSMTAAGKAATGYAVHPNKFWTVKGETPAPKPPKKAKAKKATKGEDFRRLDDGRVYCQSCAGPFDATVDVVSGKATCPQGHSGVVVELEAAPAG